MKSAGKLMEHVNARMKYCLGESFMIFFITAGALSAFIIAWIIMAGVTGGFRTPFTIVMSAAAELLLMWAVFTPLEYGIKWYRLQQVRGQTVPARGIFSCYLSLSRMLRVYHISLIITARKLAVVIPAAAAAGAAYYILQNGRNILLYCVSAVFMLIAAGLLVLYIVLCIRYSLASFIYVLGPGISINELARESRRIFKEKGSYCVKILLSISWLIIPCLLVFPAVFIIPYIQMVYTAMINEIIRQEERYADYYETG